ncbi:hypothetical protein OIU77_007617 [Salix suchowensis]|uniref:Uncharacterized protein n=1 Tax=Salix suchowensis TaxID=1278906 RepID=A0ABQ9AIV4_9ROSI|nr:hypothetical protein OIU77_007617 [Salix suchowensis]
MAAWKQVSRLIMEMSSILPEWPFLNERNKDGFYHNHKAECYHHGLRIEIVINYCLI